jgi:hypothetical protein
VEGRDADVPRGYVDGKQSESTVHADTWKSTIRGLHVPGVLPMRGDIMDLEELMGGGTEPEQCEHPCCHGPMPWSGRPRAPLALFSGECPVPCRQMVMIGVSPAAPQLCLMHSSVRGRWGGSAG